MHSGEKSNKCNQWDFASSQIHNLGEHLKTHNGEKSYKCIQCDFVFYFRSIFRRILKCTAEKSQDCVINVNFPFLVRQFKENTHCRVVQMQQVQLCFLLYKHFEETFKNRTLEKSQTCMINVASLTLMILNFRIWTFRYSTY